MEDINFKIYRKETHAMTQNVKVPSGNRKYQEDRKQVERYKKGKTVGIK
jgi:hypothetical protein